MNGASTFPPPIDEDDQLVRFRRGKFLLPFSTAIFGGASFADAVPKPTRFYLFELPRV